MTLDLLTENELESQKNTNVTLGLFCKLDFVVSSDRSIVEPTQKKKFLVFVIDFIDMITLVKTCLFQ